MHQREGALIIVHRTTHSNPFTEYPCIILITTKSSCIHQQAGQEICRKKQDNAGSARQPASGITQSPCFEQGCWFFLLIATIAAPVSLSNLVPLCEAIPKMRSCHSKGKTNQTCNLLLPCPVLYLNLASRKGFCPVLPAFPIISY